MSDPVIATIHASPGRRFLGLTCMGGLAFLLFWVAFATPPSLEWQIFLLVLGGTSLWLTMRMYRATALSIELTEREVRDSSGTVIAAFDDIAALDRGFFAFKPSNGFLMKTKGKGPAAWQPGLWWRLGNRIGVGGMTPGSQAKAMAEIIAIKLARRDGGV